MRAGAECQMRDVRPRRVEPVRLRVVPCSGSRFAAATLTLTPAEIASPPSSHPLQVSCRTTTVPNSVRNNAPVGHTSRHLACVRCLHTSELISHRKSVRDSAPVASPVRSNFGTPGRVPGRDEPPPARGCRFCAYAQSARRSFGTNTASAHAQSVHRRARAHKSCGDRRIMRKALHPPKAGHRAEELLRQGSSHP